MRRAARGPGPRDRRPRLGGGVRAFSPSLRGCAPRSERLAVWKTEDVEALLANVWAVVVTAIVVTVVLISGLVALVRGPAGPVAAEMCHTFSEHGVDSQFFVLKGCAKGLTAQNTWPLKELNNEGGRL